MTILILSPNVLETNEDKMMKLSPYAPEFHPTIGLMVEPSLNLCICNDGVPSLTLTCESDIFNLLHGIPDEALDERFAPTANEAAELDAVMDFVEVMATLSIMEDCEERARTNFGHIQKRWEARRTQGLTGRPRPAKHLVQEVPHGMRPSSSRDIVCKGSHAQRARSMNALKLLQRENELRTKHQDTMNRMPQGAKQNHFIQQPRKLN